MRFKSKVSAIDITGHLLIGIFLTIITLGIYLLFYPYSLYKFVIERSYMIDEYGDAHRLKCKFDLSNQVGHMFLWLLLIIATLGFGYYFYIYKTLSYAFNNTTIEKTIDNSKINNKVNTPKQQEKLQDKTDQYKSSESNKYTQDNVIEKK